MDLFEAMLTQPSARGYTDQDVSDDDVHTILEAATWAPNHKHTEPWRFHVLAGDARTALGDRVAAWLRDSEGASESQIESTCKKLVRAPVLIILTQAGTSVLATSNLSAQNVLALLG